MLRGKKEGRYINCFISQTVYDDLEKFVNESGQTKTRALEKAIKFYIKAWRDKYGDNIDIDS